MRRLAAPFCILLLAALALPGATAGDLPASAWRRLLERPTEPRRPLLGLLACGEMGIVHEDCLEAESEYEEEEEEDDEERVDDDLIWLLERGREAEVAAGLLQRIAVDVEVRLPSGRIHRGRLVGAPGRRIPFARTRAQRLITDYVVELACDNSGGLRPCAIGDPYVQTLLDGLALDVRPFPVGDDRVALDVMWQAGRIEQPVERLETRARFLGALDLPRYDGLLLSASGTTAAGEPLELVLEREGQRYELRLTPRVFGSARPRPLDAGLLVVPPTAVGFSPYPDRFLNPPAQVLPEVVQQLPVADRATLWELIDDLARETPMRLLPHGPIWLDAEPAVCERVRRALDALTARAARTVRVEVVARAGETVLGRTAIPVLTGRTAFFRLGVDRAMLLDADVEVG